jgi:hypothetical protein
VDSAVKFGASSPKRSAMSDLFFGDGGQTRSVVARKSSGRVRNRQRKRAPVCSDREDGPSIAYTRTSCKDSSGLSLP